MTSSNMPDGFKQVQQTFTQHMRDPDKNPAPDAIEDRRLRIYRDLIYNNIQNFLANSFPVIRKIMSDQEWHLLMRQYISQHVAQTPLFPKMPQEFLKYLEEDNSRIPGSYPYLAELAHYEWIETALSLDTREIDETSINPKGDMLEGVPVINPVSAQLVYHWPVHKLSPEYLPDSTTEKPTFLIVFRKHDYEVGFMELNDVTARLIEKISNNEKLSGRELLLEISNEMQHPNPEIVVNSGLEILMNLLEKAVLIGTRQTS